jgi:hypothetical protein
MYRQSHLKALFGKSQIETDLTLHLYFKQEEYYLLGYNAV